MLILIFAWKSFFRFFALASFNYYFFLLGVIQSITTAQQQKFQSESFILWILSVARSHPHKDGTDNWFFFLLLLLFTNNGKCKIVSNEFAVSVFFSWRHATSENVALTVCGKGFLEQVFPHTQILLATSWWRCAFAECGPKKVQRRPDQKIRKR